MKKIDRVDAMFVGDSNWSCSTSMSGVLILLILS